jgi:hypothetical protein
MFLWGWSIDRRLQTHLCAANREVAVAAVGWLKYVYLARASKPQSERPLYRLIRAQKVRRIVEVGIGRLDRAEMLIRVAQRYARGQEVSYTGLDWFDARPKDQPPLSLKAAHCHLQTTGAVVRLVPGLPARSLSTVANAHRGTGLMVFSAAVGDAELEPAWFYVPRMLTAHSVVLREEVSAEGITAFTRLTLDRIAEWVRQTGTRRAA